jgi:glycosyltransferase involved in cell wall biosynthesis
MKIKIIGWAGINHSYCVTSESYINGLTKSSSDLHFYFNEYEYFNKDWKRFRNSIFDTFPKSNENDEYDITMRFVYPPILTPDPQSKQTIVFMTCEFDIISECMDPSNVCDNVWILVPSEYSKNGLINTGFNKDKIFVVPHCYDYVDIKETKQELRKKHGFPLNDYIYYHSSSLTGNKNFKAILDCFEIIYRSDPNVLLFVKGNDKAYGSRDKLIELLDLHARPSNFKCLNKIKYIGNDVNDKTIAEFYELSDCYVSPFLAEGFNMPVLEALCYGMKVICTRGGPPDEFAKDAYFITSQPKEIEDSVMINGRKQNKKCLFPAVNELLKTMMFVSLVNKNIDKKYYRQKYSNENIGKLLFQELEKLLTYSHEYPDVILLDSKNINQLIKNIYYFSDKIKIYVAKNNEEQYIQNDKNIIITEVRTENIVYMMKEVMQKNNLKKALFLDSNCLAFESPYVMWKNMGMNGNCYFSFEGRIVCVHSELENRNEFIKLGEIMSINIFLNSENVQAEKRDRTIIPFTVKNNQPEKVHLLMRTNEDEIEKYYIKPEDLTMTPQKLLKQVEIALLTQRDFPKYQKIYGAAKLTMLFNENNINMTPEEGMKIVHDKIFVYPEMLDLFFEKIYKFFNIKFTLYTLDCAFVKEEKYKLLDTKKLIIECIYI